MEYKRICSNCKKDIIYKSKSAMIFANKNHSLCRSCGALKRLELKRFANLEILLDNTYKTFYWIGFLLADGSFIDSRLKLGLSIHDKNHIKKFAKFIQYKKQIKTKYIKIKNKKIGFCLLDIQDKIFIPLIRNKFDIKNTKTYNPPNTINKWNKKLTLALFAGFIDGDGSIIKNKNRKDARLTIKIHSSWLHILEEFSIKFFGKNYCKITKNGYAQLVISQFPLIRKLKIELLNLNIPLLKRKWNNINENYINKLEKSQIIKPKIKKDFKNGISRKDICKKYNVSMAFLTKILK